MLACVGQIDKIWGYKDCVVFQCLFQYGFCGWMLLLIPTLFSAYSVLISCCQHCWSYSIACKTVNDAVEGLLYVRGWGIRIWEKWWWVLQSKYLQVSCNSYTHLVGERLISSSCDLLVLLLLLLRSHQLMISTRHETIKIIIHSDIGRAEKKKQLGAFS